LIFFFLIYFSDGTSVVPLRCSFVPEKMHGRAPEVKLERRRILPLLCRCDIKPNKKTKQKLLRPCNCHYASSVFHVFILSIFPCIYKTRSFVSAPWWCSDCTLIGCHNSHEVSCISHLFWRVNCSKILNYLLAY
jgi:hypothetical protein